MAKSRTLATFLEKCKSAKISKIIAKIAKYGKNCKILQNIVKIANLPFLHFCNFCHGLRRSLLPAELLFSHCAAVFPGNAEYGKNCKNCKKMQNFRVFKPANRLTTKKTIMRLEHRLTSLHPDTNCEFTKNMKKCIKKHEKL